MEQSLPVSPLPTLLGRKRAELSLCRCLPGKPGELPQLPPTPDSLRPTGAGNRQVPPERWALTVVQWNEFMASCKATSRWKVLEEQRRGYVNAHDVNDHFVKPWTEGTGSGIALCMNPRDQLQAQLMLSHTWAEDLTECGEALNHFCRRNCLPGSTAVWFCLFSNYQAGQDTEDPGPSMEEQLAMDPFGNVIKSVQKQCGMLVIHTSRAEVYERLWCVYEIATALREGCETHSACSLRYASTSHRKLQDVLDVNTKNACCSSPSDEALICDRVATSGGFQRLDKEIFNFRVNMLLELASEAGELRSLSKSISKVEQRLVQGSSSSSTSGSTFSGSSSSSSLRWMASSKRVFLAVNLGMLALVGVTVAIIMEVREHEAGSESSFPTTTYSIPGDGQWIHGGGDDHDPGGAPDGGGTATTRNPTHQQDKEPDKEPDKLPWPTDTRTTTTWPSEAAGTHSDTDRLDPGSTPPPPPPPPPPSFAATTTFPQPAASDTTTTEYTDRPPDRLLNRLLLFGGLAVGLAVLPVAAALLFQRRVAALRVQAETPTRLQLERLQVVRQMVAQQMDVMESSLQGPQAI